MLRSPFTLFAGIVVPLALVGTSRSARAGQAPPVMSLTVERAGGVSAPPLLAGAPISGGEPSVAPPAGGEVPVAPPTGSVPERLGLAIGAANRIATLPYIWGGGHGSFDAAGYDCSGSVSYVLHAAEALAAPEDSSELEAYGEPGPGRWITVYAKASHTFMTLGGMRYDTSGLAGSGSRWHPLDQIPAGYVLRHPIGL